MPDPVYLTDEMRKILNEKLSRHVVVDGNCHVWIGPTVLSAGKNPYGVMMVNHRKVYVRRLVYLANNLRPSLLNYAIDCTCSNPLCVNPDHLVRSNRVKSNGHGRKRQRNKWVQTR